MGPPFDSQQQGVAWRGRLTKGATTARQRLSCPSCAPPPRPNSGRARASRLNASTRDITIPGDNTGKQGAAKEENGALDGQPSAPIPPETRQSTRTVAIGDVPLGSAAVVAASRSPAALAKSVDNPREESEDEGKDERTVVVKATAK